MSGKSRLTSITMFARENPVKSNTTHYQMVSIYCVESRHIESRVLTAVSTGGSKSILADSIMKTVYFSRLSSDCSPCLCRRALTKHIGLPALEECMLAYDIKVRYQGVTSDPSEPRAKKTSIHILVFSM